MKTAKTKDPDLLKSLSDLLLSGDSNNYQLASSMIKSLRIDIKKLANFVLTEGYVENVRSFADINVEFKDYKIIKENDYWNRFNKNLSSKFIVYSYDFPFLDNMPKETFWIEEINQWNTLSHDGHRSFCSNFYGSKWEKGKSRQVYYQSSQWDSKERRYVLNIDIEAYSKSIEDLLFREREKKDHFYQIIKKKLEEMAK